MLGNANPKRGQSLERRRVDTHIEYLWQGEWYCEADMNQVMSDYDRRAASSARKRLEADRKRSGLARFEGRYCV